MYNENSPPGLNADKIVPPEAKEGLGAIRWTGVTLDKSSA
jgi:hypothetical protein